MSPLDILKTRWAAAMPVPFVEVINTNVTTDELPDRWGTAFEDSNTREDLTMGSAPWVLEDGNLVTALFCKSGIGRSALDDAIAALRASFHGYHTPDHQLHFTSVIGPAADDNEGIGEWHRLTFVITYRFRTRRTEPPLPLQPPLPTCRGRDVAQEGVRVLGLGEAINNLKKIEERLRNNILRRASRAAGQIYLKSVKAQAYGGGRTRRTGLLGRSPGVTVSKKGDRILGRVKMRPLNIGGQTKFAKGVRKARGISADAVRRYAAFYWRFLEKGVSGERKTKSGASRGSLTARPWVGPIFNADQGPAIEAYRITVQKGLVDEALKLPKTYKNRR